MFSKSISRRISMLTVGSLLFVGLAFGESVTLKQLALEKEGIQLIGQLEDVSRDVRFNADRLSSLNNGPRDSKWSQQYHLMQIKELVNGGLRPALDRLTTIQSELKDWHQDAIDKLLASAGSLAAATNSAIINHNKMGSMPPVLNQEYKDLISRINEQAEALVTISDAAGDYASAHEQAQQAGLIVSEQ